MERDNFRRQLLLKAAMSKWWITSLEPTYLITKLSADDISNNEHL